MRLTRLIWLGIVAIALTAGAGFVRPQGADAALYVAVGTTVNISKLAGHHSEPTVAVNPTNTNQVFMASNGGAGGLHAASSANGGTTWTTYNLATGGGGDGFAQACCDAAASWDSFGNLFVTYLTSVGAVTGGNRAVIVLRSSTGASGSWTQQAQLDDGTGRDQPTIATGAGAVWATWNQGSGIVASGAAVTGLGVVGAFSAAQTATGAPGVGGQFGDITIGPSGQVVVTYQSNTVIYGNLDSDGLGAGGFGAQFTISSTNVAKFDAIPVQASRTIDSEVSLQYDRSGGPFNGRLYALYTDEPIDENNNTQIFLRVSTDDGATWSAPLLVNDDATLRSQFFPHLSIDQATGFLGMTWEDCRNSAANDSAQLYGTFSTDGGVTVRPNVQVTAGVSMIPPGVNPNQFGDYRWSAFQAGKLYVVWTDNSNSTGNNPNGALGVADIYFNTVRIFDDTTPPIAVIDTKPPAFSNDSTPTFTFHGQDGLGPTASGIDHLECSLDGAAFSLCTSPLTYGILAAGPHTFRVRAIDKAGNIGAPVQWDWTIDLTVPVLTVIYEALTPGGPVPYVPGSQFPATGPNWSPYPVRVTWTCTDVGSGLVHWATFVQTFTNSGSWTVFPRGTTAADDCRDLAGNKAPPQPPTNTSVKVDTNNPVCYISGSTKLVTVGVNTAINWALVKSDGTSGVATTELLSVVNGLGASNTNWTLGVGGDTTGEVMFTSKPSTVVFTWRVTDFAGNTSTCTATAQAN